MRGNQLYIDGHFYRIDYSGTIPPWPFQVWDDSTESWQPVAFCPGVANSSPLVLLPNPYNFVAATSADDGQPPDLVLTALGDVISVGGM